MNPPEERVKQMMLYQQRAHELAQKITAEWQHVHPDDMRGLTDAVYRALVDEANLELRQIFAQLSGQLELAGARLDRGQPALSADKIRSLVSAVERASSLMEVYMDRSAAAKMIIRIDAEEFDLAKAFEAYVAVHGIEDRVELAALPCPVIADRAKLLDALGHLVTRFYFASGAHEKVLVQCQVVEGQIEGFIGLSPSSVAPEQLMEEMRVPLAIEDVGIDISYSRAIVERHGGVLFVATAGEHSAGFGFHLPIFGGAA